MSVRGDRNTNSTLNTVNVSSRVRCKDARETPNFIELFVPCNQHIAMNGLEKKNNKKIHSRKPRNRHSRLLFQARVELSMWDTCFSLRLRSYQSVCLACSVLMCPWIILINAIPVHGFALPCASAWSRQFKRRGLRCGCPQTHHSVTFHVLVCAFAFACILHKSANIHSFEASAEGTMWASVSVQLKRAMASAKDNEWTKKKKKRNEKYRSKLKEF